VWYRVGEPGDNLKLGREAGEEIRAEAGEKFFEELMAYVQDIQVHAHCDVCLCVAWLARAPAPWLVTRWTRSLSFWLASLARELVHAHGPTGDAAFDAYEKKAWQGGWGHVAVELASYVAIVWR